MPARSAETPAGLIWDRISGGSAREMPRLSRDRIVGATMAIADGEGIDGITMRRVASALGSRPMSLYRHIQSKVDLLDLILDTAFGEITLPERPSGDWRADLLLIAQETRALLLRHPWLAGLLSSRPPLGPNYLRYFEFCLAAIAALHVDIRMTVQIFGLVYVYVTGFAAYEVGEAESARRTGLSDAEKHILAGPYVERLIATGDYPHFARFFEAGTVTGDEDNFEFGLSCLLDGLAARLPAAGSK
jgi:AcrR family transcriptional regulator